jgi:hypothetical protein
MRLALVAALIIALVAPASADPDYFGHGAPRNQVVLHQERARTTRQRVLVWSLFGATALAGGVGVYFHLDSRSAAREVTTTHDLVVGTWTPDRQHTYDRAARSGTYAIVGYSVAGACLVGALAAAWLTRPGYEDKPIVALVRGGAIVGVAGHL